MQFEGYELRYKKPTDIATLLMSDPDIEHRIDWKWTYNKGYIEHAHNTDGWLDLVAHFWPFVLKGYISSSQVDYVLLIFL